MQVVRDVVQVGTESGGEGDRVEAVVAARGGAFPQPARGALAYLGQHVALGHEVGAARDDVAGCLGEGVVGGLHDWRFWSEP